MDNNAVFLVLLLLLLPAISNGQTIPTYGAPTKLYGEWVGGLTGGVLGGTPSYSNPYSESNADCVAINAAGLRTCLANAASGDVVYVADGVTILLNSDSVWYGTLPSEYYCNSAGFYVKPGVILAGGRGRVSNPGVIRLATGYRANEVNAIVALGAGAKVTGLHIEGWQDGTVGNLLWVAVECGDGSEVYNNEINSVGYVGVGSYRVHNVWIHHNYIHHVQQEGYGYPIAVTSSVGTSTASYNVDSTASILAEGNIINYARHFIAASRGRSSYIFRYNYLGPECTSTQVDCHGQNDDWPKYSAKDGDEYLFPAGENIEVYGNTATHVMAPNGSPQPFVGIRGAPYSAGSISVHHNWIYLPEDYISTSKGVDGSVHHGSAISEKMYNMPENYIAPREGPFIRMEVHDNWYGTSAPSDCETTTTITTTTSTSTIYTTSIRTTSTIEASTSTPMTTSTISRVTSTIYAISGGGGGGIGSSSTATQENVKISIAGFSVELDYNLVEWMKIASVVALGLMILMIYRKIKH